MYAVLGTSFFFILILSFSLPKPVANVGWLISHPKPYENLIDLTVNNSRLFEFSGLVCVHFWLINLCDCRLMWLLTSVVRFASFSLKVSADDFLVRITRYSWLIGSCGFIRWIRWGHHQCTGSSTPWTVSLTIENNLSHRIKNRPVVYRSSVQL